MKCGAVHGIKFMNEIEKLEQLLINTKIPYEKYDVDQLGVQFWYPSEDNVISDAVCHKYSMGGPDGLFEIMGLTDNGDEVEGYLTAEEVFSKWNRHFSNSVR